MTKIRYVKNDEVIAHRAVLITLCCYSVCFNLSVSSKSPMRLSFGFFPEKQLMGRGMDGGEEGEGLDRWGGRKLHVRGRASGNQQQQKPIQVATLIALIECWQRICRYRFWNDIVISGRHSRTEMIDPGRTRACNLWFRRPTPYPLGHRAIWHRASQVAYQHKFPLSRWLANTVDALYSFASNFMRKMKWCMGSILSGIVWIMNAEEPACCRCSFLGG